MRMALLLFPLPLFAVSVTIDGTGTGQTFQGIGGVSAGASSRSLQDYPTQQKSEILDYLFKPNYGAALQHLKVEIGGDMNSTDGTEPSHERANGTIDCNRGYEWPLMTQAIARNASITLDSLMWGTAGYNVTFHSASNQTYVTDWLTCAAGKSLTIGYTGDWNETGGSSTWEKGLKTAMVSAGFSTAGSIDDQSGGNYFPSANSWNGDSTWQAAAPVLNIHYPNYSVYGTCNASNSQFSGDANTARATHGAQLWDSEDGAWFYHSGAGVANWTGAQDTATLINCNYLTQKIVKTELWPLYTGFYGILPIFNGSQGIGQLLANQPWSGYYEVSPTIWAIAHTTQFIQPGWQYLDGASGAIGSNGTYTCAKSSTAYSCVIETRGVVGSTSFTMTIQGGLSTGAVHEWLSNSSTQFIQQADVCGSSCSSYTFSVPADSIATITTTTGQAKGSTTPPGSASFPFPYVDSFESYSAGALPKYFSDQSGAFEIASCTGGHSGNCLRQALATAPIYWPTQASWTHPTSIIGDATWTDYEVTADVMLEQAGTVGVAGRLGAVSQSGNINGYLLQVTNAGAWKVTTGYALGSIRGSICSGTGLTVGTGSWHTALIKFSGTAVTASWDGSQICNVTDATYAAGMAMVNVDGYTNVQFDNFGACVTSGCPVAPTVTTTTASSITTTTASSGGAVSSDGGSAVTSEGVCYAITATPTSPCTSDGTATPFTSSLSGLAPNTTYHYRAFAANIVGTAYGSDLTLTTLNNVTPATARNGQLSTSGAIRTQ